MTEILSVRNVSFTERYEEMGKDGEQVLLDCQHD